MIVILNTASLPKRVHGNNVRSLGYIQIKLGDDYHCHMLIYTQNLNGYYIISGFVFFFFFSIRGTSFDLVRILVYQYAFCIMGYLFFNMENQVRGTEERLIWDELILAKICFLFMTWSTIPQHFAQHPYTRL